MRYQSINTWMFMASIYVNRSYDLPNMIFTLKWIPANAIRQIIFKMIYE
jgi:hypothetical protein